MFNLSCLLVIALLPLEGLSQTCGKCPNEFTRVEKWKRCYKVFDQKASWDRAYNTCSQLNSHLAILRSANDSRALMEVFEPVKGFCFGFYTAGKRECADKFVWVTGPGNRWKMSYTNWRNGEPNNHDGKENCIQVIGRGKIRWNDLRCSAEQCFICEVDI